MKRIIHTLISLFLVSACTTVPVVLPEKYNLDNYMESADLITIYKVSDCENIDNQSIILESDHSDYYLLVLRQPIDMDYAHQSIGIENTVSKDQSRSTQSIIGYRTTNGKAPGTEFVQAPSNIRRIVSGHDRVIAADDSGNNKFYVIEKIYKLNGRAQAQEIKERLRKYPATF